MSGRLIVGLGLLLALSVPAARAQDDPPGSRGAGGGKDEAFRMVDAYMIANLQESLGLSDDEYVEAIPLVKKLQTERRDYFLSRARKQRELRRLLHTGGATAAQVEAALEALKTVETEGPDRVRKALAALDALLTPLQQAKFRVLEVEVEQRMRELMRRARRERSKERGERP